MSVGFSLDVRWMFVGCSLDARWMFVGCSLDVRWVFVGLSLASRWIVIECLPAKPVLVLDGDRPPARGRPWQRTFRRADGGACKIKKRLSLLRPNACLNVSLTRENWVSGGGACKIKKLTQHP